MTSARRLRSPAAIVLALVSTAAAQIDAPQERRSEPFFFTAFGREYVGRASAILEAEVLGVERIGVTTTTFVRLRPEAWLHGAPKGEPERERAELAVLGKLATAPAKGTRQLVFLRRDPKTGQLEILASNPSEGEFGRRQRAVVEAYLRIALLEPAARFPAFREFQEGELTAKGWPRYHALRELAEIAVAEPARWRAEDLARWRKACEPDAEAAKILDRLEREWRKAREARG
ncbi:MAG: hypothetical protein JNM84_09880 [Planctomycetes bacterium]|nr:hypothetical protein [Planctomycetota bacterium]